MDISTILLLLATGIFVGVVNTFGGAAAVVSITVFSALGLPMNVANGTNRIPVLFQCMMMSLNFGRQKILDFRTGFKLGIPTVLGAIMGSGFASIASNALFVILLSSVLILFLVFLLINPTSKMSHGGVARQRRVRKSDYIWFFLIGLYGGCFHIGVGYFILAVVVVAMGYNLLEANALKGFIVLLYTPFALAVFILNDQVDYTFGLIHAVGNVIGAYFASKYARYVNLGFIKWLLIVLVFITILDLYGIISIKDAVIFVIK